MQLPKPIADLLHGNPKDKLVIAGAIASVGAIAFLARGSVGGSSSTKAKSANPLDAAQIALGPSAAATPAKAPLYTAGLPPVITPAANVPTSFSAPASNPGTFTAAPARPAPASTTAIAPTTTGSGPAPRQMAISAAPLVLGPAPAPTPAPLFADRSGNMLSLAELLARFTTPGVAPTESSGPLLTGGFVENPLVTPSGGAYPNTIAFIGPNLPSQGAGTPGDSSIALSA